MAHFTNEGVEVTQLNLHDVPVKVIEALRRVQLYKTVDGRMKSLTQPEKVTEAIIYYLEKKHKIKL